MTGGLLLTQTTSNSLVYLPYSDDTCSSYKCFKSGDARTTENLGLTGIHTVFLHEHNRIAGQLAKVHHDWNDETLYQETRRIIIAILQHIIYSGYIPAVIGTAGRTTWGIIPSSDSTYSTVPNTSVRTPLFLITIL